MWCLLQFIVTLLLIVLAVSICFDLHHHQPVIDYFPIKSPSDTHLIFCLSSSSHCQNVWTRRSSWRTLTWWWLGPTSWPSSPATVRRSKTTDPGLFLSTVIINDSFPRSLTQACSYFRMKSLLIPEQVLEGRRRFRGSGSRVRDRRRQIRAAVGRWWCHRWRDQESHGQKWVTSNFDVKPLLTDRASWLYHKKGF